jgi:hypothetical protein
MKYFSKVISFLLAITFTQSVFAGGGDDCHFHGNKPAAKETVIKCADQRKGKLISRSKIDAGWGPVKHESIITIDGEKGKEWKVTFNNPASSDKSKTNLYLFFSESGNFIAANHSGK